MIDRGMANEQRTLSEELIRVNARKAPFATLNVTATVLGSAQNFHVVPVQEALIVSRLSVCNVTGSAATLNVYVVPSGGSAGVSNAALVGYSVAANTAIDIAPLIGGYWTPGATIKVFSGTNGALTLSGHYEQVF